MAQRDAYQKTSSETPEVDPSVIPDGPYCYRLSGWDGDRLRTTPCPYWSIDRNRPTQRNGYCRFLDEGDWQGDGFSLLWDQVKECGIREDFADDLK